jgi:hypothetical protein
MEPALIFEPLEIGFALRRHAEQGSSGLSLVDHVRQAQALFDAVTHALERIEFHMRLNARLGPSFRPAR